MLRSAWDAIVVGAGPAGSALACRLRPRHRVLLLERTPRVLRPRIGESLPGAARVLLHAGGNLARFAAAGHAERGATVSQWDSTVPVWFDSLRDPNGPGWHLDRARFDADLRLDAAAAGARLIDDCGPLRVRRDAEGWQVFDEASGQTHRARILVDATGHAAAIVRQLGLARRIEDRLICLHAFLPPQAGDDDQCTRVCADDDGWWYSVRLPGGGRVLAFHLDADDAKLQRLRTPSIFLQQARRHEVLAAVLPSSTSAAVHARPAGSAVLDRIAMAQAPAQFYAIGDAGLAFDPIASQGLFHALASAESAAAAIARAAEGEADARDAHLEEMAAVHAHYRRRFHDTYAGPQRYRQGRFWSRRQGLAGE